VTGHSQLFYFCGTLIVIGAVEAAIFWMAPRWERPGLFFAVTVSPEFRSSRKGHNILWVYRMLVIALIAIGAGLIVAGESPQRWALLILGIAWLAFGPMVAFLIARESVLPHAAQSVVVQEFMKAPRAAHSPGGWLLQVGPFAILAAAAIFLRMNWARIPEIFPIHWGIDGRPNGWSVRTPAGVYGPLMMGASIIAGLALVTYGVLHEARVVRVPGAPSQTRDLPHQVGYFLSGIEYFLAVVFAFVSLMPLMGPPNIAFLLIFPIVLIAVVFVAAHQLNQKSARTLPAAVLPGADGVFGDGTLDQHWKLGIFYYNPDDPALMVEKRLGIGYTLNFARGRAWLILVLLLVIPVALAIGAVSRNG